MKKNKEFFSWGVVIPWKRTCRVMKVLIVLLTMTLVSFASGGYSQTKNFTFQLKNVSLLEIFNEIEEQSDMQIAYDISSIDINQRINISVKGAPVENVLKEALQNTGLSYRIMNRYIIISTKGGISGQVMQQPVDVSGKVTDTAGVPLPGVTILIKGTVQGIITDTDGDYSLPKVPADAILVFSFVGMRTQEIAVSGKSQINVSLEEETIGLEEVVAVGYGTQKKATLTGSISNVKGENLSKTPSVNFSNSLAGQLPGLVVITRTGEPGNDNSTLRIRGENTLNDNTPLVVVDGIPNRSLDRLDPATIESVTVLKDASAAIYGAKAANGVILVTTKRGETGKPTITLSLNQGWNKPTELPRMTDAATYAQLINEIRSYAGEDAKYTDEDIQLYRDGTDPWGHPNTDWFKETIRPWSPQHYVNLSLSGGSERVKYFVSMGTKYQDGIFRHSAIYYSQADITSNLDAKISDYIHFSFDLSGRQENRHYSGTGDSGGDNNQNVWWAMNRAYPYLPAYWPTGEPGPDVEYGANPVVLVTDATGYDKKKTYVMQSNMRLVVDIPWVKGLSVTGNASVDKTFYNRKRWTTPWYLYSWDGSSYDGNNVPVLTKVQKGYTDARLKQWMTDGTTITLNGLINYNGTFAEKHGVKVLLGIERITGDDMGFNAFRRYYTSESIAELDEGGASLKDNGGSSSESAYLNYFGRINYNFDSKYLFEFIAREDGSYIFNKGHRYGFFPGVSVGWIISNENFWKNNCPFIDYFKLRGSWGQTGNDRVNPYQFTESFAYSGTYLFNEDVSEKTLSSTRIPNENITWEVASQYNIGFDSQILDNKFNASFDYFHNLRSKILCYRNASVPATAGLTLPEENIGKVINQGVEAQIGYRNKVRDFKYQIAVNASYAKNKIKFWDETPGVPEYQQSTGRPMNAALYYHAIGVFKDQAAVDAYPHREEARPGDIIFEDVNGDHKIDGEDKVRNNKTNIPKLTGGVSINLQYKNFYMNALFQGAAGAVRAYMVFSGECGNFMYNEIKNRWTEDNPSTTHPRTWNRNTEYWMTDGAPNNTYWVRNSNYLRLKNMEIGYNLPFQFIKKFGIEGARVYVNGQNLYTLTKMKDFDPESPSGGATGGCGVSNEVYPSNKTMNFGVTVTF